MTREEAIKEIKEAYGNSEYTDEIIKALEQEPCEDAVAKERYGDLMSIHTQGLDEGIRCAMCANSMKSDRGCDGGCVVDDGMYKKVMETIKNHIVPSVTPTQDWIPVSERLPKANTAVLTYVDTGTSKTYCLAYWNDVRDGWEEWIGYDLIEKERGYKVLAWMSCMPIPEPYKAESEE